MKILAVDDDKTILKALTFMLNSEDCTLDCADNAKTAAKMVEETDYDFVLVDFRMPDNDGAWFMKNAKLSAKTKALLMTAFGTRGVIDLMFKCGVQGYLMKPFDREDILRHLAFHSHTREYSLHDRMN